jgi:soluble lytic murein transglycosylase-like protein
MAVREPATIRRRESNLRGNAQIRLAGLALALTLAFTCKSFAEGLENICEAEMIRAARAHDVPLALLYAVALTESGQRGTLRAYAMNVDGRPTFGVSLQDGLMRFAAAKAKGARLIDVGCMQVNQFYHGASFRSVADMFDPRQNVSYAAKFLHDLHESQGSWTLAIARYHAGPGKPAAQKSYVCAVIANMIASGFGSWTPQSKSFCAG